MQLHAQLFLFCFMITFDREECSNLYENDHFFSIFSHLGPFPPGLGRLKSVLYFLQFLASLRRGLY